VLIYPPTMSMRISKVKTMSRGLPFLGAESRRKRGLTGEGAVAKTDLRRMHPNMVTHYPSPAALFWDKTPCVSLAEFMLDYQEKGMWPYTAGILSWV
jgi:hypothetical protein